MRKDKWINICRFSEEPINPLRLTAKASIFEVKSGLGVATLYKKLELWEGVLNRAHWSRKYPTELSIKIANRNVRKIKMLLAIHGQYHESMEKDFNGIGRIQFSGKTRHFIFSKFNFRCAECGLTSSDSSLHIDHIIPIVMGGSNRLDNLQVLCKKCNLSKHTDIWEAGK